MQDKRYKIKCKGGMIWCGKGFSKSRAFPFGEGGKNLRFLTDEAMEQCVFAEESPGSKCLLLPHQALPDGNASFPVGEAFAIRKGFALWDALAA